MGRPFYPPAFLMNPTLCDLNSWNSTSYSVNQSGGMKTIDLPRFSLRTFAEIYESHTHVRTYTYTNTNL